MKKKTAVVYTKHIGIRYKVYRQDGGKVNVELNDLQAFDATDPPAAVQQHAYPSLPSSTAEKKKINF